MISLGLLTKKLLLFAGVLVLVAVAAAPSWYFYNQYRASQLRLQNPTEAAKEQAKAIITALGKLMVLPKDEEPTIATVSDITKLTSQPFFAAAQNGDKVLFYTNAKKAILYRPSANLIINVAPITLGNASGSGQVAASTTEVTFDLRNGTTIVDLAKKHEAELLKRVPNAVVLSRANAQKQDYKNSILIDNTAGGNPAAAGISRALSLALEKLPAGEATSSAQFTIIVGADKE